MPIKRDANGRFAASAAANKLSDKADVADQSTKKINFRGMTTTSHDANAHMKAAIAHLAAATAHTTAAKIAKAEGDKALASTHLEKAEDHKLSAADAHHLAKDAENWGSQIKSDLRTKFRQVSRVSRI